MKRIAFTVLILAASIFAHPAAASFESEDLDDPNLRVSEGKVVSVDRSNQTITVDAGIPMKFSASRGTKIRSEATMYSEDIKLSDINPGDYVTVEYVRKGEETRSPEKTLRITVENKAGGNN